eukprot:Em0001g658a
MDNSYQESNPTDYTYGDTGLEDISDSALDETIHDTHEEQIDSDSDFEFGAYFEELENTTNESYYPFPSKIFALLFLLVYSPHPMGRRNLTFVWFILKSMGVKTPSMSSVMAFKLPETEASLKSLGRPDIASAIVRHPVCTEDKYTEMFHGNRWHTDNRFMSPMVKLTDGTSCFVYDCVKSCLKEVLAEVDILLDLAQFRQMVPDTTATHMDTDALILYHSSAVIAVRDILGFAEPPRIVVRWTPPNFSRMTLQCDKTENPDELSELRTMSLALQQIAEIEALRTEQEKIEMRKLYGVRETLNPLFSIHADLYRTKMYGNVCQHYKSFVGRDFKGWSQMALFILGPYLDGGQTQVLLTFSKVFQIAYCEFFCVQLSEEWKGICCSFIDSVKTHMPLLLNKPKTHLILHLVDCMIDFGPSSAFSAER